MFTLPKSALLMLCLGASIATFSQYTRSSSGTGRHDQVVVLSSQAEVNAFRKTSIKGHLIIHGRSIVNLDALSILTSVGGSVTIVDNPNLVSTAGLQNVATIGNSWPGGNILIANNASLTTLDGFASLKTLAGAIHIERNKRLEHIAAFGSLQRAAGISIINNDALTGVDGFMQLRELTASDKALPGTGGVLAIYGNASLPNLAGFGQLAKVSSPFAASISIQHNARLADLDGLHAVVAMHGIFTSIVVADNALLNNVNGLGNIRTIGRNSKLTVKNNPSLNSCCGLYAVLTLKPDVVHISNNGATCTKQDILAAGPCSLCSESVTLRSQQDVDTFGAHGCTTVGSLYINGANITNLEALASITTIESSLSIQYNPLLTSLHGLHNITTTGAGISVEHNDQLTAVELNSMRLIKGSLRISQNASLQSIHFDALDSVVTGAGAGEVAILDNPVLAAISMWLKNIQGESVRFALSGNALLESLTFRRLATLKGTSNATFEISGNNVLGSIRPLAHLVNLEAPSRTLTVANNPLLNDCCALHDLIEKSAPQQITIAGNGGGCTIESVMASGCTCQSTSVTLASQQEVDDYPRLSPCTRMQNLFISGADITNLDSLSIITRVEYAVSIYDNPLLTDLTGLDNLQSLGEGAGDGLEDRGVFIRNNGALKDINTFHNFASFSQVVVVGNSSLEKITTFNNATTIGGLTLRDNPKLKNLDGFNALATLTGNYKRCCRDPLDALIIDNNDALGDMSGFAALHTIGGDYPINTIVKIINNDGLTDLAGFESLANIRTIRGVNFTISNNHALTSIESLANVVSFGGFQPSPVVITDNPMLALCCTALKLTNSTAPSVYTIAGNAPGCSLSEITDPNGPCATTTLSARIAVYPNPNNGRFTVSITDSDGGDYRLELRDVMGNVQRSAMLTKASNTGSTDVTWQQDMTTMPRGVYVAVVYRGDTVVAKRRVIIN